MDCQPSILAEVPRHADFLFLVRRAAVSAAQGVKQLSGVPCTEHLLVGLGPYLVVELGLEMSGRSRSAALSMFA